MLKEEKQKSKSLCHKVNQNRVEEIHLSVVDFFFFNYSECAEHIQQRIKILF